MFKNFNSRLTKSSAIALFFALLGLAFAAPAAAVYTVTPVTWNIIGLDSNTPAAGPNHFPVGARVCGGTPLASDTATLTWDAGGTDSGTYIYLRAGSANPVTFTFGAGGCADAFFEVEINPVAAAYDQTRRYHITSGGVSTPTPRELYVEHLVSQARNGVTDIKMNGISVAAGGSMNLVVGNTYTIELDAFTATQGYSQLESFINFSNVVFQVLAVNTTYSVVSAGNSGGVTSPNSYLYSNACLWDSDSASPYYRSCLGSGNAGGTIATTYTIKILGGGGTTVALSTLAHDFSGSSFHYNSDYSVTARYANIIDPTATTISKSFFPSTTNAGGVSTLTFTLTNPNAGAVSGLNFIDIFPVAPGAMTLSSTTTTNTCGGTLTDNSGGALAVGSVGIKLAGGTVPASSGCIVQVDVTAPILGSYTNTSNHLFVDLLDTGKLATASLTVNTTPPLPLVSSACSVPATLATWTMEGPATAPPAYFSKASDVSAATATFVTVTGAQSILNNLGAPNNTYAWGGTAPTAGNGWRETYNSMANYFQFVLDTSNYGGVTMTFDGIPYSAGNWANPNSNVFINTSADGGAFTSYGGSAGPWPQSAKNAWTTISNIPAATTGTSTTTFRLGVDGSGNSKPGATYYLDNVIFKGCTRPDPNLLAITKSFATSPVAVNGTSVLTFNIANTNTTSTASLTGISFTDTLPLQALQGTVAVTNASPTVTGSGTAFLTQLAATSSVSIGGVSYTVLSITSDTALTLTANYAGVTTSGLTMSAGQTVASPLTTTLTNCGAATLQNDSGGVLAAGAPGIKLTSFTLAPGAPSCVVTVLVKANTAGALQNVSGFISSTESGTNTSATGVAKATLTAILPPSISKLFAPNPILANGVSTLAFTLTNPNQNDALSGVTFTDTFPMLALAGTVAVTNGSPTVTGTGTAFLTQLAAGNIVSIGGVSYKVLSIASNISLTLTANYAAATTSGLTMSASMAVASPLTTTNTCGGAALQDSGSGALAADDVGIKLPSGSIPAGGSCTVTVKITAPATGTYNNTSGAVSATTAGTGNTATASLTVNPAHPAISAFKEAAATNVPATLWNYYLTVPTGGNVYYRFQVQNDGDVPLTSVAVTDDHLNLAGCVWHDGDGVLLVAPFTLQVANNANNQDFAVCILGPYAAVAGTHTNIMSVDGTYSTVHYTDTDWAEYATTGLTLAKSATQTSFTGAGNALNYSYVVSNSGSATLQGPVTVTDDKATVTCPAVSTAILTASLPAIVPGDGDNWLDPGEQITCTATYTVAAIDVTARLVTNTAHATAGGVDSPDASLTIPLAPPSITLLKTVAVYWDPVNLLVNPKFIPGAIAQYTLISSNSGGPADNNSTIITDPLPANTALYVNDIGGAPAGPVSFVDGATTSSLTLNAANLSFSNSGGAGPWNYVPVPGADGCDPAVTHLRINPQGAFAGGTPNASFQLIFRTCVK